MECNTLVCLGKDTTKVNHANANIMSRPHCICPRFHLQVAVSEVSWLEDESEWSTGALKHLAILAGTGDNMPHCYNKLVRCPASKYTL